MTIAEARFSNSLRPRKPEGSLGRTAQDGHLDSHTAPELCGGAEDRLGLLMFVFISILTPLPTPALHLPLPPPPRRLR